MGALFSVLTGKLSARNPRRDCAVFIAAAALALGCFLVGFRAAAQVPTGAHILAGPDVGRISATSVTVTWTTDKSKVGEVVWGPKAGKYDRKIQEGLPAADHSLTLTGLTRNTTYHFKVKTGSAKSKDGTFTTANYSDAPFTFADMGDNRGATHDTDMRSVTPSFQNIVNAAVLKAPAFTVHVGDFFHGPGTPSQMTTMYSVFKTAIQPLVTPPPPRPTHSPSARGTTRCRPAIPRARPRQQFDTNALFNLEMPNQPQNGPEGYVGTCFSFDYGNTHVASIDTNRYRRLVHQLGFQFLEPERRGNRLAGPGPHRGPEPPRPPHLRLRPRPALEPGRRRVDLRHLGDAGRHLRRAGHGGRGGLGHDPDLPGRDELDARGFRARR